MSKSGIRIAAMALTSAGVLAVVGSGAGAATTAARTASLASIQAKAAAAISLRVDDLNAAIAKVQAAKYLGSESATLEAYLQADVVPLQQLGDKIAADDAVTTAEGDTATIFTNFRVLALVLPASHLAGDSQSIINGAVPTLTADASRAATYVDPADEAMLDPLISDLHAQIGAATAAASAIAATVLADTPAQWNSDQALLSGPRASLDAATSDIKKARADVKQIRADLKSAHPAVTPTSTP